MTDQYSHIAVSRQIHRPKSPIDTRHRVKKPQGRYAQILEFIGYGRAPETPQARALSRM